MIKSAPHAEPSAARQKQGESRAAKAAEVNIQSSEKPEKPRTFMQAMGIVCVIFAGIFALIAIGEVSILALTVFFGILAGMFFVLSKSSRRKRGILNREKWMPKSTFVLLCILGAFIAFVTILLLLTM